MSDSFVETGDEIKSQDDNSTGGGKKKGGPNWNSHLIDPHMSFTLSFAFTHPIPSYKQIRDETRGSN